MYSRSRFDALTDGVFSVAMTLLVIDVRLPDATPRDAEAFVAGLRALEPKLLAYALSFFVLGASWLAKIVARKRAETLGRREALLTLIYLFLVTLTPFSTMVLSAGALTGGTDVVASVWVYCGNLGALGLVAALIELARRSHATPHDSPASIASPLLLCVAGCLGAAIATLGSHYWPYAFLITVPGAWRARKSAKGLAANPS